MGLILDTSALIESERGRLDLDRLTTTEAAGEPLALPSIVAAEYLHGWERAPPGRRRESRLAFFDDLLRLVPVIAFDLDVARVHARLWADLSRAGVSVGAHDLIVAATCLHLDWRLVTLNRAEFGRIHGVVLVPTDPYLRT